jgi:hypothetical protein
VNRQGKKASRDIVQFVAVRELRGLVGQTQEGALATQLLAEVPAQLVGYYQVS